MTTQTTRPQYPEFNKILPHAGSGLMALAQDTSTHLSADLIELLEVRVSQINGCAYCVQYHIGLARKANVASTKLDLLATWREAGAIYGPAEQAALSWAEALTDVSGQGAPDALWTTLNEHFTKEQVVALTTVIATINAWNRIAIGLAFAPAR